MEMPNAVCVANGSSHKNALKTLGMEFFGNKVGHGSLAKHYLFPIIKIIYGKCMWR
jgi:hypothetical protein